MREYAYTEFDAFCAENGRSLTVHNVYQFGLAVILALRDHAPAIASEFALKRQQQIAANTDEREVLSWRLACWALVRNSEPQADSNVAFVRAVLCFLYPIADSLEHPGMLLDDFTMFMEMAGDFELVMMAHRHLLLTPRAATCFSTS